MSNAVRIREFTRRWINETSAMVMGFALRTGVSALLAAGLFASSATIGHTRRPHIGHGCLPRSDHRARAMASCHQGSTSTGSLPTSQGK